MANEKKDTAWVDDVVAKLATTMAARTEAARKASDELAQLRVGRKRAWEQIVLPGLRLAVDRMNVHISGSTDMTLESNNADEPTVLLAVKLGEVEGRARIRANFTAATVHGEYGTSNRLGKRESDANFSFVGGPGETITFNGGTDQSRAGELLLRDWLEGLIG